MTVPGAALASQVSRRLFLGAAAGVVGAGTLGVDATPRAHAAQEATRVRLPHLKSSLAAYSFSRVLPRAWTPETLPTAKMTLDDFVTYCGRLGLDGCELTGYYFPKTVTPEYLAHLKQITHRRGLDISGTAIANDFALPDGPARDAQLDHVRLWIDHAAALGAPAIRIFAGNPRKGEDEATAVKRIVAGLDAVLPHAAAKGVFLALENHGGGTTASGKQMVGILEAISPCPWFGFNLDTGNFGTPDPYADMKIVAPHSVNVQIKVSLSVDGQKQPADWPRIVGILRDSGYQGYVVLEYEEKEEPREAIPPLVEKLQKLLDA